MILLRSALLGLCRVMIHVDDLQLSQNERLCESAANVGSEFNCSVTFQRVGRLRGWGLEGRVQTVRKRLDMLFKGLVPAHDR